MTLFSTNELQEQQWLEEMRKKYPDVLVELRKENAKKDIEPGIPREAKLALLEDCAWVIVGLVAHHFFPESRIPYVAIAWGCISFVYFIHRYSLYNEMLESYKRSNERFIVGMEEMEYRWREGAEFRKMVEESTEQREIEKKRQQSENIQNWFAYNLETC